MKILKHFDLKKFSEVRLVTQGDNRIVSIQEAWQQAQDEGLDLIVVGEVANPPVVKIQDYNKLKYEQSKKLKEQKKKSKQSDLKEIQFKARIDTNDLNIKVNKINQFLEDGNKVKIVVRLKGRERSVPQIGWDLIDKVIEKVTVDHKVARPRSPSPLVILEP